MYLKHLLLAILVSVPAYACDSFEDCMKPKSQYQKDFIGESQADYLKAIAYKLADIEKKLGPDPKELAEVINLIHKKGGRVHGIDDEKV